MILKNDEFFFFKFISKLPLCFYYSSSEHENTELFDVMLHPKK